MIELVQEKLFEKNVKKITKILECANTSEYYHGLFEQAGIDFSKELTYEDFKRIPTTDKAVYEKNKYGMITSKISGYDLEELQKINSLDERYAYFQACGIKSKITSGSTGQPLEVLKGKKDVFRDYVVLNEYRRKLTKYDFSGMFVQIWPVNEMVYKKYHPNDEYREYISLNERGYMYLLSEHSQEKLLRIYHFLIEKGCEWITSSPTVSYKIAKLILDNNLSRPNIRYIECHSEKLYDWQREVIYQAFQCDISSVYSSNEVQFIGAECKNGKMHLFDKGCFLEIVPDEEGHCEIVLTSLNYCEIPVIRYRIGDCGKWDESEQCDCEFFDLPSFEIYGFRKNDLIKTKNGSIEPFLIADSIFALAHEDRIYIRLYRAIQTDYYKFTFYIPIENLNKDKEVIKKRIEEFLSVGLSNPVEVMLEEFDLDESTYYSKKFRYFETMVQ